MYHFLLFDLPFLIFEEFMNQNLVKFLKQFKRVGIVVKLHEHVRLATEGIKEKKHDKEC